MSRERRKRFIRRAEAIEEKFAKDPSSVTVREWKYYNRWLQRERGLHPTQYRGQPLRKWQMNSRRRNLALNKHIREWGVLETMRGLAVLPMRPGAQIVLEITLDELKQEVGYSTPFLIKSINWLQEHGGLVRRRVAGGCVEYILGHISPGKPDYVDEFDRTIRGTARWTDWFTVDFVEQKKAEPDYAKREKNRKRKRGKEAKKTRRRGQKPG